MVAQESHYTRPGDRARWPLADTDWGQVRANGDSLIFRYLYAERFRDGTPLDAAWLHGVEDDLHAAREAGMKVVLRFAYRAGQDPVLRGHPFGDSPAVQAVLAHIDQLMPVVADNADAVLAVEQGFYGLWGECCYTDHFSSGYDERQVSETNWADRMRVLQRILSHTRTSGIPILARYSALRERLLETSTPAADRDRVGLHDDAFDAGEDDLGTFTLNSSQSAEKARSEAFDLALRLPFGGEHSGATSTATTRTQIDAVLQSRHPSFLLRPQLPPSWSQNTDLLSRRLGYRLAVTGLRVAPTPQRGGTARLELDLENSGVAPPMGQRSLTVEIGPSERPATLTLEHLDLRALAPSSTTTIWADIGLPPWLPSGEHPVRLWLPDPSPRLRQDARHAIRLGNRGTWDARTGRNLVGTVVIGDQP